MGKGYKHGVNGKKEESPLNFAVTAYPSEVELNTATPKDTSIFNIGVVTTNPITGWHFACEQPETMAEGEVWFFTGTYSTGKFNALKQNSVMVYPMSVKQMVSGALQEVIAKFYQSGAWVEWALYLYNNGDERTNITGGWTSAGKPWSSSVNNSKAPTLTKNEDSMSVTISGTGGGVVATNQTVDVSEYKNLHAEITASAARGNEFSTFALLKPGYSYISDAGGNKVAQAFISQNANKHTLTIPLDGLTGKYTIAFILYANNSTYDITIYNVWME